MSAALQGFRHQGGQVGGADRVTPLVVVPGDDLDEGACFLAQNHGKGQVDGRAARIALVIDADQRLIRRAQDAFQRASSRGLAVSPGAAVRWWWASPVRAVRSITETVEMGTRKA